MTHQQVRLLLVDDHEVLRLGLRTLFDTAGGFLVVGEAGTVAEGIAQARAQRPDVAIVDLRLPDGSGVEACREIRSERPETRVVVLTSYSDEDAVISSIVSGAAGYLLKQTPPRQLVEAVRTVALGGSLLDPYVNNTLKNLHGRRSENRGLFPGRQRRPT